MAVASGQVLFALGGMVREAAELFAVAAAPEDVSQRDAPLGRWLSPAVARLPGVGAALRQLGLAAAEPPQTSSSAHAAGNGEQEEQAEQVLPLEATRPLRSAWAADFSSSVTGSEWPPLVRDVLLLSSMEVRHHPCMPCCLAPASGVPSSRPFSRQRSLQQPSSDGRHE